MSGKDRLVPHGWHSTAAIRLADAGVDMREGQSVTGHRSQGTLDGSELNGSGQPESGLRKRGPAEEQAQNETGKR